MKRSLKFMAWITGAAALLAAGLGCSHETHPAEEPAPPVGTTTSPPFESNVGPSEATPPPAPEMGAPQPPVEQPKAEQPQPGISAPQPGEPAAAVADDRELCDTLPNTAHLKVEDVRSGVTIIMTPRGGAALPTLHEDAHRIENGIHAAPGREAMGAEPCGLFTLGRLAGVRTQVIDKTGSVVLTITTTNPAEIKDLRRQARDEVSKMGKGR